MAGQSRKAVQYEIGNPLTATKMARHKIEAALYAPLRVALYEEELGGCAFAYDLPSSLLEQFADEGVLAVARELDEALRSALLRATESTHAAVSSASRQHPLAVTSERPPCIRLQLPADHRRTTA
jgi:hypothetical protein